VAPLPRADSGGAPGEKRITFGAETRLDGGDVYFARVSGIDATFAVAAPVVASILAALE
jgi:hypothetical protein